MTTTITWNSAYNCHSTNVGGYYIEIYWDKDAFQTKINHRVLKSRHTDVETCKRYALRTVLVWMEDAIKSLKEAGA